MRNKFEFFTAKIIYLFLAVILISCNSCFLNKKINKDSNEIKGINLFTKLDFVKSDNGKTFTVNDSVSIFYYKDLVLYRIPVPFDSMKAISKTKDTVTNQYVSTKINHKYFLFRQGNKIGLQYDSLNFSPHQFEVDSFLKFNSFSNAKFYDKTNDSLYKEFFDNNSVLTRIYVPKVKYDPSYNDTTKMFFSKSLNDIDFSFSSDLDSQLKMKLFRVEAIFNPIPKGLYSFAVPKRTFLFEMKANKESDLQMEKKYFRLFQSQMQRKRS